MSKLKRKLDKEDTAKIQTKLENEAKVKFESMETDAERRSESVYD
jgi:hypothetical protein